MTPALARNDRIVLIFPGSAIASVAAIGSLRGLTAVEVPDGTQPGATLVGTVWVNAEPAQPLPESSRPPRLLLSTDFRGRFTAIEEASVLTLAKTDPVVQAFYSRLLDPRQINVDLDNPQIAQGLGYLATLDDPLSTSIPKTKVLTPARIAEILV